MTTNLQTITAISGMGECQPTQGRYVYGIATGGESTELGRIGLDGENVRTIPHRDICAVVHNCLARPYESQNMEMVKGWVQAHQGVLDTARRKFGTVLPLGFDTIMRSPDGIAEADQVVISWLRENYERLTAIIEDIRGKDEYGVQVFYDTGILRAGVASHCDALKHIQENIPDESAGLAYLHRHQLEKMIKAEIEKAADRYFTDFCERIKRHSVDVVVEKTKKAGNGQEMLLNLSCLVAADDVECLGEELEEINSIEGFSVSFSGPWPPYSFVNGAKDAAERLMK